jgi:MarR family transcriptional regulator, 2-MHQ and catechol-resistance regulon repressor
VATWIALLRAQQGMDRAARQSIANAGLCFSDFVLLEALLHIGPLTPSQLSDKVGLTRGSITAAVDRLGARGLVVRTHNILDARSLFVELSEDGRAVIETAWESHSADIARVVQAALTDVERKQLFELLRSLQRAAERDVQLPRGGTPSRGARITTREQVGSISASG